MSQTALSPPTFRPFRPLVCAGISVLLGVTQGLGVNMVAANLAAVQGALGATPVEGGWLLAAYYAVSVSSSLLLVKFRQQFGFRLFAELGLGLFLAVAAAHLLVHDLRSGIAVRAAQGFAAAPLSTLAIFYMIEAFPAERRSMAMALGLGSTQIAIPLARVIAPDLLQIGEWQGLYLPELGLAMMCFAAVHLVRLTPQPQSPAFDRLDILSFGLLVPSLGLLCVVLSQGRLVWWTDAPWLGVCLATAFVLFALALAVEMNRTHPLINVRWLTSEEMFRLGIAVILFRIVLSEQSVGAFGFLQALGFSNEQMGGLSWVVLAATAAGFVTAAFTMHPEWLRIPGLTALALIAAAAWADSHITSQANPASLYVTQAMLGFAGALFLPSAMLAGISRAVRRGPAYIVSFIALFSAGQNLGGLIGSSVLGTYVIARQRVHLAQIDEAMRVGDPAVAGRLRQLAGVYAHQLTDRPLAGAEGAALLARQALREATVLAYGDLFRVIAVLAALAFCYFAFVEARDKLRPGPATVTG